MSPWRCLARQRCRGAALKKQKVSLWRQDQNTQTNEKKSSERTGHKKVVKLTSRTGHNKVVKLLDIVTI